MAQATYDIWVKGSPEKNELGDCEFLALVPRRPIPNPCKGQTAKLNDGSDDSSHPVTMLCRPFLAPYDAVHGGEGNLIPQELT